MNNYKNNRMFHFDEISKMAPAEEGDRQRYFIEQVRTIWKQKFEDLAASGEAKERYGEAVFARLMEEGRCGTFHIATFGCQMNARDSEKLAGILDQIGLLEVDSENADFVL